MPIIFNKETKEWSIETESPEELNEIVQIGKQCIVEGLAYRFTKFATYKSFLEHAPQGSYYQA
jgi:hypothetical protein